MVLPGTISALPVLSRGRSRAINAENPTGAKGAGGKSASILGPSRKGSPCLLNILPGETRTLAHIKSPGMITHIWITVDNATDAFNRYMLRDLVLRFYWDGEEIPSVECPLGDFFCCGFGQECLVNSSLIAVVPSRGLNAYLPMPFFKEARITLENQHANAIPAFFYQIDYCEYDALPKDTLQLHAQWRREKITRTGVDYTLLDGVKGQGHFVGTYLALSTLERYWWGEGEVKFYIDDDGDYPTICGTGMEDYFGGSWSFASHENGRMQENTYCTPYLGYPFHSNRDTAILDDYHNDDCPPMRGFYRWHVPDPIFFEKNLRVSVQQIGVHAGRLFERQDDLSSVAWWYQSEPHCVFPALPTREERWPR